jgi:hypothetical protein
MATIHRDWHEFLSALLSENTRFLLIGAHALAYHVEARLTEDLDRIRVDSHGLEIDVIGRDALLKNKRASGRKKDQVDVALLEEATADDD